MFHSLVIPAIYIKEWCGELFSFWIHCLKLLHDLGLGYQRLLVYFCKTVIPCHSVSQLKRKMSLLLRKAYSAGLLMYFSWINK